MSVAVILPDRMRRSASRCQSGSFCDQEIKSSKLKADTLRLSVRSVKPANGGDEECLPVRGPSILQRPTFRTGLTTATCFGLREFQREKLVPNLSERRGAGYYGKKADHDSLGDGAYQLTPAGGAANGHPKI